MPSLRYFVDDAEGAATRVHVSLLPVVVVVLSFRMSWLSFVLSCCEIFESGICGIVDDVEVDEGPCCCGCCCCCCCGIIADGVVVVVAELVMI